MPPIQYWFTGTALAAAIAFLPLAYAWYSAAVGEMQKASLTLASDEQKIKTAQVKDFLGKAIASGTRLIDAQKDKDDDAAEKAAQAWGQNTRDLIIAAYGDGEATLFLDSSGFVFYGDNSRTSGTRNWIDGRLRRLTELLRRADTLTLRKDFDPAKFR